MSSWPSSIIPKLSLGLCAVFWWDVLQSLPEEISLYRRRKVSLISGAFFFVRWLAFINTVLTMVRFEGAVTTQHVCRTLAWLPDIFMVFTQFLTSYLLLFRTWSIWDRNYRAAMVVAMLMWLCFIPAFVSLALTRRGGFDATAGTCTVTRDSGNLAVDPWFAYFAGMFLVDAIVTGLAAKRLWSQRKQFGWLIATERIVMKDGMLFFIVPTLINLVNTIFYTARASGTYGLGWEDLAAPFASFAMPIMAQRLALIHLHALRYAPGSDPEEHTVAAPPHFRTSTEPISASLWRTSTSRSAKPSVRTIFGSPKPSVDTVREPSEPSDDTVRSPKPSGDAVLRASIYSPPPNMTLIESFKRASLPDAPDTPRRSSRRRPASQGDVERSGADAAPFAMEDAAGAADVKPLRTHSRSSSTGSFGSQKSTKSSAPGRSVLVTQEDHVQEEMEEVVTPIKYPEVRNAPPDSRSFDPSLRRRSSTEQVRLGHHRELTSF